MGSDKERSRRRVKRTESNDALVGYTQSTEIKKVMAKSGSLRNLGASSRSERRSSKKQVDDYDVALAKVRARFEGGGSKDSGEEKRKEEGKEQRSQSRLAAVPKNYEDALAKVAARFSMSTRKSGGEGYNEDGEQKKSKGSRVLNIPNNYEDALAKVASRFSTSDSRSSGKETKRRGSKKKADSVPTSHADALAKVAARFTSSRSSGRGSIKRGSSNNKLGDEDEEEQIRRAAGNFDDEPEERDVGDVEDSRPRYSRQSSFDSTDEDRAIAEALSEEATTHKRASHKKKVIDEPTRKVERRGSDSSVNQSSSQLKEKQKERGRGIRRTTSEELHPLEFAENAEKDERVRECHSPKRRGSGMKIKKAPKVKKSVMFVEDPEAKHGIYCQFLESGGALTPEEKTGAWYGGRNYKLFKSLCYSESVEAKENEDYCMRFDKVWAACATVSVDFAWQELMKAEHKKTAPNNAVMLAKARCRGFEREIFPEVLLRNRLATVKYVVRSFRQASASMTMTQDERDEAVRDASVRCSRPFRRFARLIAEGDSLLVAAWERVKRPTSSLSEDEGEMGGSRRDLMSSTSKGSRRDLMSAAPKGSRRNLMSGASSGSRRDLMSGASSGSRRDLMSAASSGNRRESRRDLMHSFKSSGSARKLLSQQPGESRRDLLSRGDSHRDMMMSLKSSGSSRKLMSGMGDYNRQQSRRDLMSSLHSSGSSRHIMRNKFEDVEEEEEPIMVQRRLSRGSVRR